ncbi:hypothetical protein [Flavobacterium gelatinilyticum]|uniref:hypothetical protein n=1 Tax=Flavobacterium gelatinilyticum TaxID=3003260 RepID=UPI002480DB6C|nr:hypothetical protein [Flavobacterium gelatinilyticum]
MIIERNKKYLLYRILMSHILILFIYIGGNLTLSNILPIWIVSVVLPNFILSFLKNLKAVEIHDDYIILIFSKYFKKHKESYRYTDLRFTYKNEFEGANSRGLKFRIYKKDIDKSIVNIGGLIDGWYENQIIEIITELEKNKIEVL